MSKAMLSLLKEGMITKCSNAVAAGFGDEVTGTGVDMQGYEGVLFICALGTITATGIPTLHAEQSANDSSYADLEGTACAGTASDSNKLLILDIVRPSDRYVRPVLGRATANIVVDGIYAIRYGSCKSPRTQSTTYVANSELHVSPAEGTA